MAFEYKDVNSMKIICRVKDYYDFVPYELNDTSDLTYDRSNCVLLKEDLFDWLLPDYTRFRYNYFLVEIGFVQYVFHIESVTEVIGKENALTGTFKLSKVFNENIHIFKEPITIVREIAKKFKIGGYYNLREKDFRSIHDFDFNKIQENDIKSNPIFRETKFPSIINPKEIYINLLNYLSAQKNDLSYSTPMTDVEKAENHGFDKITSFRNL
jgi:hypothetical protein